LKICGSLAERVDGAGGSNVPTLPKASGGDTRCTEQWLRRHDTVIGGDGGGACSRFLGGARTLHLCLR
jgi:hypothetical protein